MAQTEPPGTLKLDLLHHVSSVAGVDADLVWAATEDVLGTLGSQDYGALARRSPGLGKGWDWRSYLHLSSIRIAHTAALLRRRGVTGGRLLDYGAYFGNFALFARRAGFDTWAFDSYRAYDGAFEPSIRLMETRGVHIADAAEIGYDLAGLPAASFDVVLLMGVIEHIPHTPRLLLDAVGRVLRPGGTLVLETPNLAYAYTRRKLAEGRPIGAPIELQFETEIPFEGHHREYTLDEIVWILRRVGQQAIESVLYNYSLYGLSEVSGTDLSIFNEMERDPSLRELIMTASVKPGSVKPG